MQDQPIQQSNVQFHIAEYTALRATLLSNVKSSYDAVTYISIANSAIFSWLISAMSSNRNYALCVVVAWLPFLITLFGWTLLLVRNVAIARLVAYFRLVENALSIDGLGWERFVQAYKGGYFRTRHLFNLIFLVNLVLSISLGAVITYQIGVSPFK
jgi:hypothetical protein